MTPPILLFAAGLGTRMGALTKDQPKPLIKVDGKPLLDHALGLVDEAGITRRIINLHYKGEKIREHLSGQNIIFSDETNALLETGGGLRKALPLLDGNPVITMNTDAVWNGPNPIKSVIDAWDDKMEALLLVVEKKNVSGHPGKGDFDIRADGQLRRAPNMIYTGVQMMRTDVLDEIKEEAFSLNVAWNLINARSGLYGTIYNGRWCDVGQPTSIAIAEEMLNV